MTIELAGAILFFMLSVFALLFSVTKSSHIDSESFPNRGRFYAGLAIWCMAAILAVFMSFPGYTGWFVPMVYPLLKSIFLILFLAGFFMALTTLIAFPQHMNYYQREINGRSDRIALLENIRQIASQPYPVTELFTLVLKELGSFLIIQKGAVFMINPSRREMYLVSQIGLEREELRRLEHFPIGRDIISQAAVEQAPFISGDLASSDPASRKLLLAGRELTLSAAALPLSSRDRSLGALLVISDRPYRFEKPDRMLLKAAAEAVAGVVEANRLSRENQKLSHQVEESAAQLNNLRSGLNEIAGAEDGQKAMSSICRYLLDRHGILACRIVRIEEGDLIDIVREESVSDTSTSSESYQVAVIDAIRRKKMVVLNQEARGEGGTTYISRSALLCPFNLSNSGEYALLLEATGNGLPLTDRFLEELKSVISLITISLNNAGIQRAEGLDQDAVKSLLRILRINPEQSYQVIFRDFLVEAERLLPSGSQALVFIRDDRHQCRILDGSLIAAGDHSETVFAPGEGPVGKAAVAGQVIEYTDQNQVANGWQDIDQVNEDFLNHLGGERGTPDYQLTVPIATFGEVIAILAVFAYGTDSKTVGEEKAALLLAAQLLSVRISMAQMDERGRSQDHGELLSADGMVLNQMNNNLATIMGQAELIERQPDLPGQARYAAGEILRAAELAAGDVKQLQENITAPEDSLVEKRPALMDNLDRFLESHRVTGDLYMFDNNRTVSLRKDFSEPGTFEPGDDRIQAFLRGILEVFVTLQEEGDEILLKTQDSGGYFYISLIRGTHEKHRQFDPLAHDFGAPDVLPREIADPAMIQALAENGGEVSFDRFGRRPTYISFRFPSSDDAGQQLSEGANAAVAGLRILAIDDQQMILDLLTGICQSLGLELTALRDPDRAAAMFKSRPFDIVMVDLAIGRVSGWDIAREIKRLSPETPVILMTGWGMDIDPDRAARNGIDFTLAKPFKIEQLTDVITRAKSKLLSS
jgi:CheY-like chemotaxis protein/GAF domain-containing protein